MAKTTIESVMKEARKFEPPKDFSKNAYIKSLSEYDRIYKESIKNPEKFWAEQAEKGIDWFKKWDRVFSANQSNFEFRWFEGGKLNVSYNCLDRHLKTARKNKAAIIWQGEPENESRTYTYQQLHREVCKFANVLKSRGVKKGDRVAIYLPMIPELPVAMLACTRIGAVHSVVFGGFSADSLATRVQDCQASALVTADGYFRGGKVVASKDNADAALEKCPSMQSVIVVKRANNQVKMKPGRDFWLHEEMEKVSHVCEPEQMDAEDPLFILYTSGSTGKPKGALHTTAGYLVFVNQTFKWIFDYHEEDTFWCTADIGWITGHSYIVYGPLAAGATTLMFEGVPNFPKPDRFWQIVEKYGVNIFYTAPTVIRVMMRDGEKWPNGRDLSSLRLLGTVGEPINPEVWMWYYKYIGRGRCPIVDTWWQTETGGILITPLPGATPLKPGSATKPFPGIEPMVIKQDGTPAEVNEGGYLVIKKPWPGLMRTLYGDHKKFVDTYFAQYKVYLTGDGARLDEDGYFWLMGRVDDVIKVSGHRLGTAEIESAFVSHPTVAEASIVGFPHEIKGEGIYAYITLKSGVNETPALKSELAEHVRKVVGPIAKPDVIQFTDALPKTRSGKIMRRILRKIAAGETGELGDVSTLADPSVVERLIQGKTAVK